MPSVLLALAASVAWGVADFLGGLTSRTTALRTVLFVSQATGLLLIGGVVSARHTALPSGHFVLFAVVAGLVGTVGLGALYRGMAVGTVSIVAPITAASVIVPVSAGLIQGERPRWLQLVGMGMAVAGVVMASHQIRRGAQSDRRFNASVGLALGAALSLGCFLIALNEAGKADPFWAVFLARGAAVILLGVLLLGRRTHFSWQGRMVAALLAIGLLDTTAITLYTVSSMHGMVSLMSVLASLYPVSTVALARLFLQERTSTSQRAGTVTALAGIALIAAFQ